MGKVYTLMTIISLLIRQFCLPNPFECFGEHAVLYNWIAEPILHLIAYSFVGIFYIKGSEPLLGSIAYLFVYALLVGVLWVFGIFSFAWWWILIIVSLAIALIIGFVFLVNKLSD